MCACVFVCVSVCVCVWVSVCVHAALVEFTQQVKNKGPVGPGGLSPHLPVHLPLNESQVLWNRQITHVSCLQSVQLSATYLLIQVYRLYVITQDGMEIAHHIHRHFACRVIVHHWHVN